MASSSSQDLFGFTREMKPTGTLITSEVAALTFGGSQLTLVQQVQCTYQQRVEPKYEAGTSNVYWVSGQAGGQLTVSRLVSKAGFSLFSAVKESACKLSSISVSFGSNGGSSKCVATAKDKFTLSGVIATSVGFSYGVGQMEVTENATFNVGSMSMS